MSFRKLPKRIRWLVLGLLILGVLFCVYQVSSFASRDLAWRISEPSGLVASRQYPGVFWVHSDSGGPAKVYAVTSRGELLSTHELIETPNVDWEDIATDDQGNLYIADVGNNESSRKDLHIYQVREPDPHAGDSRLEVEKNIAFRYAEQKNFEPRSGNFDAESLTWSPGFLHLFTKHREDQESSHYRIALDIQTGAKQGQEESIRSIQAEQQLLLSEPAVYGGQATAADLHTNGRWLALLSYRSLYVFELQQGALLQTQPLAKVPLANWITRQCEAVAWDGDSILIANEEGKLFRLEAPFTWEGEFPAA